MKDKYYTPEINEFYIGFWFEKKESDNQDWRECCSGDAFFLDLRKYLKNGDIRVKYLDKEDIESLGWQGVCIGEFSDRHLFEYETSQPSESMFPNYMLWVEENNIGIHGPDCRTLFYGVIKNKSELARIMKMIGVEAK